MKRKRIVYGAGVIVLSVLLLVWLTPRDRHDLSAVRIGFAGYGVVDGEHSLILIVTNGSSYRISRPDRRECDVRGDSPESSMQISIGMHTTAFWSGRARWWQLRLPKIPSVAPGATFQFAIPVIDGPYTWRVTVPFATIPFRDRLPFALQSRWPSSKRDTPILFGVTLPPIPPAPSAQPSSTPIGGGQ